MRDERSKIRRQMAKYGQPHPELPDSFQVAFNKLQDSLTIEDMRIFASTTMVDVWKAVQDVECQLEERRTLRGFHRIRTLLAGIEKYSGVVEILCQGTLYLPFIWVCPKFCALD